MKPPFKMRTDSDMERYRYDTWDTKEPETINWIKNFKNGDIFFDIGANIGVYSLFCAATHPDSTVIAFEPHPYTFARLVGNIIDNGFNGRVKAHRTMLADKHCEAWFDHRNCEPGSSGGQMIKGASPGHDYARAIDELITYSFDFPSPNHVKIDIDGQEDKVIAGMRETLKDGRLKSILVEIDFSNDVAWFYTTMYAAGFSNFNKFNDSKHHSTERRIKEGINVRNVIFTRNFG